MAEKRADVPGMVAGRRGGPIGRSRFGLAVSAWSLQTFESMSNGSLRILWFGTLLNFGAITMNGTAQGVVAFDLTGNNKAVGAVMFGQGLSMLFISPFAGALADRFSKRLMLVTCQAILGIQFFLVGSAIATDTITIPMLAVSSFVSGTMFAVIRPVRNAYIGELASPEQRGNAVAVQQLAMTGMQIIGPFMAGILLGWNAVGSAGTYLAMGLFVVFSLLLMFQLPGTKSRVMQAGGPSFVQEMWGGIRYGYGNPEIRWVLGGFILVTIVGTPYMVLLPAYTKDVLGMSTASLGVLLGISAAGGFIVSLATASMAGSSKAPTILTCCNILLAASLVGLAFAPSFAVAALAVFFLGAGAGGFQMLNTAIALQAAEVAYMGRVAALTMMTFSLSGLVAFPIGALADAHGERAVFAGMGIAVFVVAIFLALWKKQMIRAKASAQAA